MKKNIFPKIIYYFFTFSLGIVLAFTLPYMFMFSDVPLEEMRTYLLQGEYDKAMELVGGYFNREPAYSAKFDDGGGIVLFEAATLVYNSGEEGDSTVDESKLHYAYAGFIYGIQSAYKVEGESNNQTKLVVTSSDGSSKNISLLDCDTDSNGINDSIATLLTNGFIYLDLSKEQTGGSLSKLQFIDRDGNAFQSEIDLNLSYGEAFFSDVSAFVEEYNRDFKSDKLNGLYEEFIGKDSNYAMSSYGNTRQKADRKATIVIVIYFVSIYIIGDFLVGRHYIFRFFRWLHYKTPWGKKAAQKRGQKKEVFGHDYFSQVTMSLDLSELPDFNESVQVRYTNTDVEICFTLMKDNNYTVTERVKAGTYVNAWMEINKDYAPVDMPENLVVEGYKMDVKIKILKRKEESV